MVIEPYDRVIEILEARGSRQSGSNWQCPTHDDQYPSLSVNRAETAEGTPTVLLHCHAGCSVTDEVVPALGLRPADLFDGPGSRQGHLFNPERYSPVRLAGWLALPPSVARDFGVATSLGSLLASDGTFRRIWGSADVKAVVVRKKQRKAIVQALGRSASHWRYLVAGWKRCGMAHRCSDAILCLFLRPESECAYCGVPLEPKSVSESERLSPGGVSESERLGHPTVSESERFQARFGGNDPPVLIKEVTAPPDPRGLEHLKEDSEKRARRREAASAVPREGGMSVKRLSRTGGKVHAYVPDTGWSLCNLVQPSPEPSGYRFTERPVDCGHCLERLRRLHAQDQWTRLVPMYVDAVENQEWPLTEQLLAELFQAAQYEDA